MKDSYRFDYVFSYWIFAWFIFYYFKLTTLSPLFILIIGVIDNIILYFSFIDKKENFLRIEFIIINFFIKILPLYYLIVVENKTNKLKLNDVLSSLLLFLIYILWLIINKKIYIKNKKIHIAMQRITPFYNIIKDIKLIYK
jgi:hypothetical protein